MKNSVSKFGLPEIFGLAVVGATIGAMVFGANDQALSLHSLVAAFAGAVLLPAGFCLPRIRLRRFRLHRPARS